MKTLFAILFIIIPCSLSAQGSISGKVLYGHKPLEYAVVQLMNTGIGTHTDATGHFTIANVPPGTYDISVSYTGCKTVLKHIEVAQAALLIPEIELQPDQRSLSEIVVTGVSRSTELRRSPVPMVVVTRQEIDRQVNNNIIDAIVRGTPGVAAVTTGPNISKPFIRGLGYYRVLTLYDDIRQEGQQWGDEHGIEIDEHAVERGEVVKGPASLVYGSDATAGVINMIPRMPVDNRLAGNAALGYHTNNGAASASLGLGKKYQHTYWITRGSFKTAHDYKNPVDGYVYNTGFREYNFSAKAGLIQKWGYIHIGGTWYNNLQEIPDGSRDSLTRRFTKQVYEADSDNIRSRPFVEKSELRSYNIAALHQHIQHTRIYLRSAFNMAGNTQLRVTIGGQQSVRREYNHPLYPAQPGLYVVLNTLNYDFKYDLPTWKGIESTLGVNGMLQGNACKNATDFPIPDYSLADAGTFLMLRREWGKVQLSGGLRYDGRWVRWADFYVAKEPATGFNLHTGPEAGATLQFPSFAHQYTGFSGSVGISYAPGQHFTIKANVARGYRAPNITETGSNGLDPGAHIVYLGNRDFLPEFNLQEDIGVIATFPSCTISAELFNNHIQNYIYQARAYDPQGNPVVIVPGNTTYKYQQAAARLYGGEVSASYHPATCTWLTISQSIAYTEGHNLSTTLLNKYGAAARYLPFIPPMQVRSEVSISPAKKLGRFTAVNIKVGVNILATQAHFYGVDNTEARTPGYALLYGGCNASWTDKNGKTICTVALQADNITNAVYQSNLSRLKYFEYYTAIPGGRSGIYNMGRNISIQFTVPI